MTTNTPLGGPCCCPALSLHLPRCAASRALAQQWLLPHHLPSCCLTPSVLQEPSPRRELGRTGSHLKTGELGLHVLLSQVQPGLPEEDAQAPQPKEGGGTNQGVDPEGHALSRNLRGTHRKYYWADKVQVEASCLGHQPAHPCALALTSAGL